MAQHWSPSFKVTTNNAVARPSRPHRNMEALLLQCDQFLKARKADECYYETAIANYNTETSLTEQNVPVDLKIQDATEQLQQLKFQFLEVETKHLFLEKIASSNSEPPCPTMQELAEAELEAAHEKSELKKAKLARKETQQKFDEFCKQVSDLAVAESDLRASFGRKVEEGLAGLRLKQVSDTLENGTPEDIHSLANDVNHHGAKACERLLTNIFDQLTEAKNALAAEERSVASLKSQVDQNAREQAALNARISKYRAQIESNEKQDGAAVALREESIRHEALYTVLSAVTRTKTISVDADSVSMEITVDRRLEAEDITSLREPKSVPSVYKVTMTVSEQSVGHITSLTLDPPDANVSGLASEENPLSLSEVMYEVVTRLKDRPVSPQGPLKVLS